MFKKIIFSIIVYVFHVIIFLGISRVFFNLPMKYTIFKLNFQTNKKFIWKWTWWYFAREKWRIFKFTRDCEFVSNFTTIFKHNKKSYQPGRRGSASKIRDQKFFCYWIVFDDTSRFVYNMTSKHVFVLIKNYEPPLLTCYQCYFYRMQ